MRLIEVAKKLGLTGQQLRHELAQVDFGVKSTDREISNQLAHGVIRFLARKYGITVQEEAEKEESSEAEAPAPAPPAEKEEEASREESVAAVPSAPSPEGGMDAAAQRKVHVLRKLSLEGVQHPVQVGVAVRPPPPRKPLTKAERDAKLEERKLEKLYRKKLGVEQQEQIKRKEGVVELPDAISVKEFAEKAGVQVPAVIAALMKNGVLATINQRMDYDTAAIVATELKVEVKKAQTTLSAERLLSGNLKALLAEDPAHLQPRPPVVTVMGHVDHGKTAILDAIRRSNVAASEAGGITQRIGASVVEHAGKKLTFLDTPGHEAFTAMRARGAQITDIVVLVVAADEGVRPTTVEAANHAKEGGVPILVALNKIDKPEADPDRVKGELAKLDLQPEEWGGTTPVVPCSAKTGKGIEDLLEHILLLADMGNLRGNPDRPAVATVIESHLDSTLGPVASVIVNTGTLRVSDVFVCGGTSGRVKSMVDDHGEKADGTGPSGAARIAGFDTVPEAGDILQVFEDAERAKKLMAEVMLVRRRDRSEGLSDLLSRLSAGKITALKIVLKADAQGSLEAIEEALSKMQAEGGISPKVIHSAVGGITEGDVMMAAASAGIVFGFNTEVSTHVEKLATKHGVQVRLYDVIYTLLDETQALLQGLIEPVEQERITGHLEVRGTFFQEKGEQLIGGKVTDGTIKRLPFRLFREGKQIGTGRITSLRHVERDIKEAKEGSECGLRIESDVTVAIGDTIEAYVKELKKKEE
ncbi:MAG: translation initiation factor IF-2 [Patescibacteria group bacterium]